MCSYFFPYFKITSKFGNISLISSISNKFLCAILQINGWIRMMSKIWYNIYVDETGMHDVRRVMNILWRFFE